jgi:diketogulonate reductase-like aldo/keto reductase
MEAQTEVPMEYRPFGSTGVSVSVIGQGTWEMERDPRGAVAALRRGLDLGMTHVDTAEMYGGGRVEEIVGEAVAGRRDEVFLATKVLPSNATRRGTIEACERSLRRLRTDHVDLFLLHYPSRYPLRETIAGFQELVAAGKIRAWGVSNFDAEELERADSLGGPGSVACDQVLYHLQERRVEHEVLPACERLGAALVAYSPFGQGKFPSGNPVLSRLAQARGVTPGEIALAFLVRHKVAFTIPKAVRIEHVEANARAGALMLTAEEVSAVEEAFVLAKPRRGVPTL